MAFRPALVIEVDFINDPSSATETWTNITHYARVMAGGQILSCSRGRDYERARTSAGSLRLALDNTDGRFDASNPQSPYLTGAANPGGVPGKITSKRRIRIRATWLGITYGVWRGYVNEWPQEWSNAGFRGQSTLSGSDAIAILASIDLIPAVITEMLADDPIGLYRCNDGTGSVSAANTSSTVQPLSQIVAGSTAAVSDNFAFGQQGPGAGSSLDGDPSSCLTLSPTLGSGAFTLGPGPFFIPIINWNPTGYDLTTADLGVGPLLTIAGGFSAEGWFAPGPANEASTLFAQFDKYGTPQVALAFNPLDSGALILTVCDQDGTTTSSIQSSVGTVINDNRWHHIALSLGTDMKTPALMVDGIPQSTSLSVAGAALTWAKPWTNSWGGQVSPVTPTGASATAVTTLAFFAGSLKNLAMYDAPMTPTRALARWHAGRTFTGEHSGTRISRILDTAAWPTALRSIATGDSLVGSQALEGQKALTALEQVLDTEQGNLFIDGSGQVVFDNRRARYNGTSLATFGDGPGEFHYAGGLLVQLDEREIVNDWQVSRTGGITARDQDLASQAEYFPSSNSVATIAVDDEAVVYTLEYLLSRYAQPVERIPQLVLNPQVDPSLWPQVLGREIGDQITAIRRPGAAVAKTGDFFIESIAHDVSGGTWKTTWQLSPASVAQVFELESDHGRLGGSCPLSAGTDAVQTTFDVDTALVEFSQTATPYTVLIDRELMLVTHAAAPAAGTQTLTVTRAVENTVATNHNIGTPCALAHTYGLAF